MRSEEITLTVGGALVTKRIGDFRAVVFLESDLNGNAGSVYAFINDAEAIGDDPVWRLATSADDDLINFGGQISISIDLAGVTVLDTPIEIPNPQTLLINLPPGVRLGSDFAALFILQLIQEEEVPVSPRQTSAPEGRRRLDAVGKAVLQGAAKQGAPGAAKAEAEAQAREDAEAAKEAADALGNGGVDADGLTETESGRSTRVKKTIAWVGSATLLTALGWGLLKK